MRTTVGELLEKTAPVVSVGVHAADLLHLGDELEALAEAGVTALHLDVMDGVFTPSLTFGPLIVEAVPDRFVKDVHLMVSDPLSCAATYVAAGASIISFHVESTPHPHRLLQSLGDAGVLRGLAVNPGTPLSAVEPLVEELDLLLLLAVNPGFGGEHFIESTAGRIAAARSLLAGRPRILAVDGGITRDNIGSVASLGPDLIVTGSAIFEGGGTATGARLMLEAAHTARSESPRTAPGHRQAGL